MKNSHKNQEGTFLLIDKPKGLTSHDVIDKVRKITGVRKVGHAGTLDPNATGLLVVGVGREATKRLGYLTNETKKTYVAQIHLGEARSTDDAEGEVISVDESSNKPSKREVDGILKDFLGKQMQIPPIYSAIKIGGRKAYELARKGEKVEMKAREIRIYSIKVQSYSYPILTIKIEVSSGTYIRALARDLGKKLGTEAFLENLRRTRVGKANIEDAVSLEKMTAANWEALTNDFGKEQDYSHSNS